MRSKRGAKKAQAAFSANFKRGKIGENGNDLGEEHCLTSEESRSEERH